MIINTNQTMGRNIIYENKKEVCFSDVERKCCLMFSEYHTKSSLVEIYFRNVFLFIEFIISDRDVRDIEISLIFDKCEGYAEILTELWDVTSSIKIKRKFSFLKQLKVLLMVRFGVCRLSYKGSWY